MHQVAPLHCGTVAGANSKNLRKVSESMVLGNKMQPPNIHIIVVRNPPSVRTVVCWVHTKCHSAEVRIVTQPPPPSQQ